MATRLYFGINETKSLADANDVTLEFMYAISANGGTSWTDYIYSWNPSNNNTYFQMTATSFIRRLKIRVTSNSSHIFDLSPISAIDFTNNDNYRSGVFPNGDIAYTTKIDSMTLYNSGSGYVVGTQLIVDNSQIDENTYETIIETADESGPYAYVLLGEYLIADITPQYQLTINTTNCTSDVSSGIYYQGDVVSVTLTPNNGYGFKDIPTCDDSSATIIENIDGTVTITFTVSQNTTITAVANEYFTIDLSNVYNATTNASGYHYNGNTETLIVTANNGYYFDIVPTFTYQDNYGSWHTLDFSSIDDSEYPTEFELTTTFNVHSTPYIDASAIVIPPINNVGIVTIYLPTARVLRQLSKQRIQNGTYSDYIDLGVYITDMFKLFIDIDIAGTQQIVLGTYNTQIVCDVTTDDVVTIDCGSIVVPQYYYNVMDYQNTYIRMYLPLYGFVEIETSKVMGKTITLIYKVNLLNSKTLIVLSDDSDNIIETWETNSGFRMPYILNNENRPLNDFDNNASYMYGFTPFMEITRDLDYSTDNYKSNKDVYIALNTLSGFQQIELTYHNIEASKEEIDMIIEQLRNGVLF